jgi:hypothetical protein
MPRQAASRAEDDGQKPIDDPLPEHSPVIDEPGRQAPAVDPSRPDAPRPVREPDSPLEPPRRKSGGVNASSSPRFSFSAGHAF